MDKTKINKPTAFSSENAANGKRVGIIGLDTSHSTAFTQALNSATADPAYDGYKIVAAYPQGSKTIKAVMKEYLLILKK